MIAVERIDFIARPVADIARASEFYGETLGLARNPSSDEHWAEYETGNLTIALSEHGGLGLGVPDVEEARRTLEGAGVEFPRDIYDSGVCLTSGFSDPAGNKLFVHKRYAPLERWDGDVTGVERTDFVGIPVTDRPAGVTFYNETLGLARNTRSSDEWPEFEPGNATILLNTPEQTGTPFRPSNYAVATPRARRCAVDAGAQGQGRRVPVRGAVRLGRLPHGVLQRSRRQRADPPPPAQAVLRRVAPLAMQVEQVDFVSVPTRDITRAVAFYRDVLELRESAFTEGEVEVGDLTLSFWNPEEQGEPFVPNANGIALRVPDVHEAVEDFRASGGEVMGIEDSGVCHMGFVKDPDGNVIILHRRYADRKRRDES